MDVTSIVAVRPQDTTGLIGGAPSYSQQCAYPLLSLILSFTCVSLLSVIKLDKSCVLLVKQDLDTDYIAIHTYQKAIYIDCRL